MSSGTSWETLFGQFSDGMKLVREGNRTPERASIVLSALISDDDIVVRPKAQMVGGEKIFHVTGNFETAKAAIDAGKYDYKYGYAGDMSKVPMAIQPVDARVRIVVPGRVVYNRELFGLIPNLVDPFTALCFGVKFPEEQREHPLGTLWRDATGQLWYVFLYRGGSGRGVSVDQDGADSDWGEGVGFLARE